MIIDAVIFSNEVDLLEIRLHELDSIVDRFVVVEALEYHGSARPKASNFRANLETFKSFLPKIEYILLDRLEPAHQGTNDSWPRENFQRNAILQGLGGCSDSDVLMISDCDEIPRSETVRAYRHAYQNEVCSFEQDFFYYSVNSYKGKWHGTCVGSLASIRNAGGPQAVRNRRDAWTSIPNGGWHFSYFGGYERVMRKLQNFAHACEDSSKLVCCRSREEIVGAILTGADIYQRPGEERKERRSHDDPRLPAYLREHVLGKYRLATEDGLRERLT